jgi:hypothetical protein
VEGSFVAIPPAYMADYVDSGQLGELRVNPSAGHLQTSRPIPNHGRVILQGLLVCSTSPPELEVYSWRLQTLE